MPDAQPVIAYLTAGAANMYCGSCMRDNTLAAALHKLGVDVQLIPTYTPIRTDEENVSSDHVLYGGVNVYLQQKYGLFRRLPLWLDGIFDQPWLIGWLARRGMETNAANLGALTVSMLEGNSGKQQKEVRKLVDWLKRHVRPQLINLSNMLIAGCVPALKEQLRVPVLVTLQGDDIFLEQLSQPYKDQAFAQIRQLVQHIDGFLVFSRFYADFMADYFDIPHSKFRLVPMGIDVRGFQEPEFIEQPPTIGYLARLAPEKGLHQLIDAFLLLRQQPAMGGARLRIAGWLGPPNNAYANEQFARLATLGEEGAWRYHGTVDRTQKISFLRDIDVLSVPTTYQDPKGIFVLEALAAGVPVVQPDHGAFPELLAETGGGRLFRAGDPTHLAEMLHELLKDRAGRDELAKQGRQTVHARFNAEAMARSTLEIYQSFLVGPQIISAR